MPNYDFVVDYKTPEGAYMHQSNKVFDVDNIAQAANMVMHDYNSKGFHVICMSYVPGAHSLKELDTAAEQGTGNWCPLYFDHSAITDMTAPC